MATILLSMGTHVFFHTELEAFRHGLTGAASAILVFNLKVFAQCVQTTHTFPSDGKGKKKKKKKKKKERKKGSFWDYTFLLDEVSRLF